MPRTSLLNAPYAGGAGIGQYVFLRLSTDAPQKWHDLGEPICNSTFRRHRSPGSLLGFIATLLRGTEWVATGKVTQAVPKDFPGKAERKSRSFKFSEQVKIAF